MEPNKYFDNFIIAVFLSLSVIIPYIVIDALI